MTLLSNRSMRQVAVLCRRSCDQDLMGVVSRHAARGHLGHYECKPLVTGSAPLSLDNVCLVAYVDEDMADTFVSELRSVAATAPAFSEDELDAFARYNPKHFACLASQPEAPVSYKDWADGSETETPAAMKV